MVTYPVNCVMTVTQPDTNLKKVSNHKGGEYHGACPFCGTGKDRFCVWPVENRWWCRQCRRGGDPAKYVMEKQGVGFREALNILGIEGDPIPRGFRSKRPLESARPTVQLSDVGEAAGLENEGWQRAAWDFSYDALDCIHASQEAQDYLFARGFSWGTILKEWVGYNPQDISTVWGGIPVWLPRGIVLPWAYKSQIWNIRIRTLDAGRSKYISPAGVSNSLYRAWALKPGQPVVIAEGELDALSIVQAAGDLINVVATGSTAWGRQARWAAVLAQASRWFVGFDDDEAGELAARYWRELLPGARRVKAPAHDWNDALLMEDGTAAIRRLFAGVGNRAYQA